MLTNINNNYYPHTRVYGYPLFTQMFFIPFFISPPNLHPPKVKLIKIQQRGSGEIWKSFVNNKDNYFKGLNSSETKEKKSTYLTAYV